MAEFILQLILLSSLAVIVYLMAIAVPRVKDDEVTANGSRNIEILPLERIDSFFNSLKEKSLRRLRIYLLKAERSVTDQLHKSKDFYKTERKKQRFILKRRKSSPVKDGSLEEDLKDQS